MPTQTSKFTWKAFLGFLGAALGFADGIASMPAVWHVVIGALIAVGTYYGVFRVKYQYRP